MSALFVGCKVMIKPEAWKRYLEVTKSDLNKPNPSPREVALMPGNQPFDNAVMLDFPLFWWHELDLELVS
jgi:hypothetical protein